MKDQRGIEFQVGQIVANAYQRGDIIKIRTGELIEIVPGNGISGYGHKPDKIRLKWTSGNFSYASRAGGLVMADKCVVVLATPPTTRL